MTLAIGVATMNSRRDSLPGDIPLAIEKATTNPEIYIRYNTAEDNLGVTGSYQELYEESHEDILAFLHDDVLIHEHGWDERVLQEFDDPQIAIAGFGGALVHGTSDLYKTPFRIEQLIRQQYLSK